MENQNLDDIMRDMVYHIISLHMEYAHGSFTEFVNMKLNETKFKKNYYGLLVKYPVSYTSVIRMPDSADVYSRLNYLLEFFNDFHETFGIKSHKVKDSHGKTRTVYSIFNEHNFYGKTANKIIREKCVDDLASDFCESLRIKYVKCIDAFTEFFSFIQGNAMNNYSSYSYQRNVSISDLANKHRNAVSMLQLDIRNFFPSISLSKFLPLLYSDSRYVKSILDLMPSDSSDTSVKLILFTKLLYATFYNGVNPIGMPYCPIISEILMNPIDYAIRERVVRRYGPGNITYTRYGDDMTFSSDVLKNSEGYILGMHVIKEVESILNEQGLYLNYDKTTLSGPNSSKTVLGIKYRNDSELTIGHEKRKALIEQYKEDPSNSSFMGHISHIYSLSYQLAEDIYLNAFLHQFKEKFTNEVSSSFTSSSEEANKLTTHVFYKMAKRLSDKRDALKVFTDSNAQLICEPKWYKNVVVKNGVPDFSGINEEECAMLKEAWPEIFGLTSLHYMLGLDETSVTNNIGGAEHNRAYRLISRISGMIPTHTYLKRYPKDFHNVNLAKNRRFVLKIMHIVANGESYFVIVPCVYIPRRVRVLDNAGITGPHIHSMAVSLMNSVVSSFFIIKRKVS